MANTIPTYSPNSSWPSLNSTDGQVSDTELSPDEIPGGAGYDPNPFPTGFDPGLPVPGGCFPVPGNRIPLQPKPKVDETAEFQTSVETLMNGLPNIRGPFGGSIDIGLDTKNLEKIAKGGDGITPEMQKAAKFLLDHPDKLKQLDTAKEGGSADGHISRGDMAAQLQTLDKARELSLKLDNRLPELKSSMDIISRYALEVDTAAGIWPDGKISREDLEKIANDYNRPPELRKACQFLMQNQDLFDMADVASEGGKVDGIMSFEDLRKFQQQLQNVKAQMPAITVPPSQFY
ncbi:MAG: hypothetical protein IPJ65_30545 [Archangiaceae bacterium]|nr:hypothetical protein [Archangiaceae bacterium]